jgi:hypothetical protein
MHHAMTRLEGARIVSESDDAGQRVDDPSSPFAPCFRFDGLTVCFHMKLCATFRCAHRTSNARHINAHRGIAASSEKRSKRQA